ncbi:KH domain-containing protein [Glycine max]|nr:KH domain-containing protein [Glycine max]
MNESFSSLITADDTIFRYLCPVPKIGSVIGRDRDIVKQLRTDTKAKIHIDGALPGCEKCVVTIHRSSEEINHFDEINDLVSPAQDALFRVHQRVIAEDAREDEDEEHVTVKLRIPKDDHLPPCALSTNEIVQGLVLELGLASSPYSAYAALYQKP